MTIQLTEHESAFFSRDEISSSVAEALSRLSPVVEVEYPNPRTLQRWNLTSGSYAGVLSLGDETLVLRPKVPVRDLLRLWERAHGLPATFGEAVNAQTVLEACDGLALRFASACLRRAHDGWPTRSIAKSERVSLLRGRFQVSATLQSAHEARPVCAWSERDGDTLLARVCKWALHRVMQSAWVGEETRRLSRRALQTLFDATLQTPTEADFTALERDLAPRDRELLALCRWVCEGTAFAPRVAESRALGFLVPMERLFERAVTRWLQEHGAREWRLQVQPRVNLPSLGADEPSRAPFFRPDLVLCERDSGRPRCAIDAKYVSDERPTSREIAQVVAYATALNCRDALLVYPGTLPSHVRAGQVRVRNASFPLDADWNACGEEVLSALRASG